MHDKSADSALMDECAQTQFIFKPITTNALFSVCGYRFENRWDSKGIGDLFGSGYPTGVNNALWHRILLAKSSVLYLLWRLAKRVVVTVRTNTVFTSRTREHCIAFWMQCSLCSFIGMKNFPNTCEE